MIQGIASFVELNVPGSLFEFIVACHIYIQGSQTIVKHINKTTAGIVDIFVQISMRFPLVATYCPAEISVLNRKR